MTAPDPRNPVIRTIDVVRAPGLPERFRIDGMGPGVTIITGPNGSGKSTTARLVQRLFWTKPDDDGADVVFGVDYDGGDWRVERAGTRVLATRDGVVRDFPIADTLPPDMRLRYLLALHDLLTGDDDQVFAQQIALEMRGGYDLEAATRSLGLSNARVRPKPEGDRYGLALKELRDRRLAQDALVAEEARLADLEQEIVAATAALAHQQRLEAIAGALDADEALADAERRVAALPPTVARVTGDEPRLLAEWTQEQTVLEARRRELEARLELAVADRAAAGVEPGEALDLDLDGLARRRDTLRERDAARQQAASDLDAARARRASAAAAAADRLPQPLTSRDGVAALEELTGALASREQADRELRELGNLQAMVDGRSARTDAAALTTGVGHLARWLQTPPPPDPALSANTRRLTLVAFVAAAALGLLSLVLAIAVHPALAIALLIAAAVAGLGWHFARPVPFVDARPDRQAEYERTGLEAPSAWEPAAVRDLMDRLVTISAAAVVANQFASHGDVLRREIERARQVAFDRAHEVAAVAERHGIPLARISSSGDVAILVDRLKALLHEDDQIAALTARLDAVTGERTSLLVAGGETLARYGFAPPADIVALDAAREALGSRRDRARDAGARRREATIEIASTIDPGLARLTANRAALFERLEITDEAGAILLAEALPGWRTAMASLQDARARSADRRQRAAVELDGWDLARVARERLAAEAAAARLRPATEERREIEVRIGEAKQATALGDALDQLSIAGADLQEKYQAEVGRLIGFDIAETVRTQTQHANLPQVMRSARDIFARITRERYDLQIDPATQQFSARDVVQGATRTLDQLSSATRVQLLLAVRAAFVEANEQGVRLPLLLDETLANADEERAEAIIHAVFDLARAGRQIFYFTAQEDEVAKWRQLAAGDSGGPLHVIDLRDARALGASGATLAPQAPAGRRLPPPPGELDWAAYGQLLQVPAIDPWSDASSWHLWRLVDELGPLHTLLARSVDTVGKASFALERLGDAGLGIPLEPARARSARIALAETLVGLWREGRGRPAAWADIVATGEVSASFAETAPPLFADCQQDAGRFVDRIRSGELRGFRNAALQRLEEKLRAQGFIVDHEPLHLDELRMRVVVAATPALDAGLVGIDLLDRWIAALAPIPAPDFVG